MSGTSMDGLDFCLLSLTVQEKTPTPRRWELEIIRTYSLALPEPYQKALRGVIAQKAAPLNILAELDWQTSQLIARGLQQALSQWQLTSEDIDILGMHGQTLWHCPPQISQAQISQGYTWQLGNPSVVAELTGIHTIGDFRSRDMAVFGQGAPLVCFADQLLFQAVGINRAVQNIGGMANVTVLSSQGLSSQEVIAFDTGPGNCLIDLLMSQWFSRPYDHNGDEAAKGQLHEDVLNAMLNDPYFHQHPPKSTGREYFNWTWLEQWFTQFPELSQVDWLRTITELTACSISEAYQRFIPPECYPNEVILGGGGTRNRFLASRLAALLKPCQLKTHEDFGIPSQYKEALAFALLAWSSFLGLKNNMPSCTGAHKGVTLGVSAHR
ncbi:MAG: anhydro-N-acetylmuramic acid kinase [Cyanobacteria bacterium]|nr:anhydro-N-acetylmuramic acid kinase [Cyanobacteriota bacterium]